MMYKVCFILLMAMVNMTGYAAERLLLAGCGWKNFFFSNWNGHTKDKSQPLLMELEQRGKVVWKLYASPEIQNISSVFWFNREIGEPIKKLISK